MTPGVSIELLYCVTDDTDGWAIWLAGERIAGPFANEDAAALGLRRMLEN